MSDKFKFRLQKVLKYRENKEKQAQNELAQLKCSLQQSLIELESLKKELIEVHAMQKTRCGKYFDLEGTLECSRYADLLVERIAEKKQIILEKEKAVTEGRLQLKDKVMERKVLSSLKDKRYLTFSKEMVLKEQKMNDELAVTSHSRK